VSGLPPLPGEVPQSGGGVFIPNQNQFSVILLFKKTPFVFPPEGEKNLVVLVKFD
jgi:hypothetical protein